MDTIRRDLLVPIKYIKLTDDRISLTVHRNWLANLSNVGPISFVEHEKLTPDEIAAQPTLEELGPEWSKIYCKVYQKQHKCAIPLPRGRHTSARAQPELTFSQLLHYVSDTNYRNLWKECYKKHYNPWTVLEQKEPYNVAATVSETHIMQEILARMYGCPLVQIQDGSVLSILPAVPTETHCNLLPVVLAVETANAFVILYEQTAVYSLRECVMYSPAALSTSHGKSLFLVYQLLRLSRDLHDRGLALGEITLSDVLLMENFTIKVVPKLSDNIILPPESEGSSSMPGNQENRGRNLSTYNRVQEGCPSNGKSQAGPDFGMNERIEKLCEMWVCNCISNFDYLTGLNNLAGRRYGEPSCHHVMPWVTDFASRCGGNWRDLTKSKFRLNKGDRQLDLTFDSQSSEVGHHVSDVLSEITYYVYLSRRYNKSVLCKHVRPLWVPGEYPASIQRLHDWSPDECIPQFFTDPSVFKSIHEDLPDLEVPAWATSPEDFIEKHREALESFYVSERLHHWIDLTFGYKLSGSAAVKSKNVCLQLVDNHTGLTDSGVVQLFTQPHPQKIVPSPYWSKIPPRLRHSSSKKPKSDQSASGRISDDEGHSSGFDDEELPTTASNASRSSPLALSRFLSRSRGSLLSAEENAKQDKSANQTILLPKDYNPVGAILQVETVHTFMNRVNNQVYKPPTNDSCHTHDSCINYKQIVASARIKEQQILGCLIVEIFLPSKFRATWNIERVSLAQRLATCISTLKTSPDGLPRCVRNAVGLLLQIDIIPGSYNVDSFQISDATSFRYPTVTYMGLPPPSAHQFLQPIFSGNLFPFSKSCQCLFNIVEMLQDYSELVRELNSIMKSEDEVDFEQINAKTRFLCKISECKVKAIARELENLLPHAGLTRDASLQLIVPHIQEIMEEPYSAVLAAWHLFDPIAKTLGPKDAADAFLLPITKLYENGSVMDGSLHTDVLPVATIAKFKTTRLYHRSFLLKLIVRLGLRRFLDNFITPLVEAVGGYRDYAQGSSITCMHRAGNLKSCDLSGACGDGEGILSPLDEDSSADSEHNVASPLGFVPTEGHPPRSLTVTVTENEVEEVFAMETEENSWITLSSGTPFDIDLHVDLSLNLSLNLNDDSNDDGGGRVSPPGSVRSPTIPIPRNSNSSSKLVAEFSSIGCHVGSKTSSEDFPYNGIYARAADPGSNTLEATEATEATEVTRQVLTGTDEQSTGQGNLVVDSQAERQVRADQQEVVTSGQAESIFYKRTTPNECTASEMSAESVIWLSHRLGPVLTARYLSRNLLRMLTLCYTGRESLTFVDEGSHVTVDGHSWHKKILPGDQSAIRILECLTAIAGLYGEHIILLQYFAHMVELLALCKRKLTQNLEGGIISCLALLNHITAYLTDAMLMDVLHESIVKAILYPAVRVLSTTRFAFPNGLLARAVLAEKYLEALFALSLRLGSVITKNHLAVPIQRFFLAFDKAFNRNSAVTAETASENTCHRVHTMTIGDHFKRTRTTSDECNNTGGSRCTSAFNSEGADSYSPPIVIGTNAETPDSQRNKAYEELRAVFTAEFAHRAYMFFYKCVDGQAMEEILKNHQHIRELCQRYEREARLTPLTSNMDAEKHNASCNVDDKVDCKVDCKVDYGTDYNMVEILEAADKGTCSFGNIPIIGNRLEIQKDDNKIIQGGENATPSRNEASYFSSNGRQLRGNWLAYWEHEIGRAEKDTAFNIKQIKLQYFSGHTNSIRCLCALDNENSFMSGGRDKTVKLWSLRSQGDGSTVSSCQYTYTGHRKSVLALTFLESLRYAVTCDGTVHCWDPFMGSLLGCPDNIRPAPVNTLAASPSPSTTLLVGTTDITLRVIDCRTFQYVNEMKVSMNPTGWIRCIAVAPSGYWVALGQASGFLTILDIRTGLIVASWKGHECEILQLEAVNETTIVSSSLDQTIAVWSALDGKLKFHIKGSTEPVHCMSTYEQELIIGTTANRIGVYTSIDPNAYFSSSKLRSDAFKGVLTALTVLPLNRLLLLGADNGGITLIC